MVKEKVLMYLSEHCGELCSGQEIANSIGVSRNTIYTNCELLISEGVQIIKQKNKGYCLREEIRIEDATEIEKYLDYKVAVEVLDEVDSTMRYLKDLQCGEPRLVIARGQSGGIGRYGKKFYSPKYKGVYMSYKSNQIYPIDDIALLTVISVNTLHKICRSYGCDLQIKYLNDLYYEGKKVSGILTNASIDVEQKELNNIIFGIGINVYPSISDDQELNLKYTNLPFAIEDKSKFIAQIIDELETRLEKRDYKYEHEYYKMHSIILGKELMLDIGIGEELIKVIDIDDKFNLVVETENGIDVLNNMDVSISYQNLFD